MAGNDNEIERAAVTIYPNLTGFREKLDTKLKAAVKGVVAEINLVADATDFNTSAKEALKKYAGSRVRPTYAVRLVADATDFNTNAREALRKYAASHVQPTYKVRLVADGSGMGLSGGGPSGSRTIRTRIKPEVDQGAATKATADLKKIEGSVLKLSDSLNREINRNLHDAFLIPKDSEALSKALSRLRSRAAVSGPSPTSGAAKAAKAEADAQDKSLSDTIAALGKRFALQRNGEIATQKFYADEKTAAENAAANTIRTNVRRQRSDEQFASFQEHIRTELGKINHERAQDEITIREDTNRRVSAIDQAGARLRIAALTAEDKASRAANASRETEARRSAQVRAAATKDAKSTFTPPQLINFGGEGVKPMNLLYASLAALSPLLISVGSSAVQAGSGIAALGAAGIGAGLAIGGLAVAFQSISSALKLRKTTLAQTATAEQNSAQTAVANAAEELRQKNALLDTAAAQLRAEKDLSDARQRAARDLVDLRQKVADLQNQQKEDAVSLLEAKDRQKTVNANFFATALDRARAAQDVNNAQTKLNDTGADRKKAQADLATGIKKGVEGSDVVVNARDQLRQARERRAEALASKSASSLAGTASKVTSPMAQLNKQIADMSPAAQEMYKWFVANDGELKSLQRTIEQKVLPGFTSTLKILNSVGADGKTSLRLAADAAGDLGSKAGDFTAGFAQITKDKGFRADFKTIVDNDSKAMDGLNRALLTLVKPFMQIFASSSPLLVRFSGYIEKIATKFAEFIDGADKSGALSKFFQRSGDELGRWVDLATQMSRLLLGLFKGSVASGGTVIERLTKFFKTAADWANSGAGQTAIRNFFDKIANLPFGQIRDFAVQLGALFGAAQIARFAAASPFFTALGLFAKSNPDAALGLMKQLNAFILYLSQHEKLLQTFLAVLIAYKALNGVSALKISLQNLAGGALPGAVPGATPGATPGVVVPGGKTGLTKPMIGNLALIAGTTVAASMVSLINTDGQDDFKKGMTSTLQGALTGAAMGSFFGPLGAAAGGIIGGSVAAFAALHEHNQQSQVKESMALGVVKDDAARQLSDPSGPIPLAQLAKRKSILDYIAARKASVAAELEELRAQGKLSQANKLSVQENKASAATLVDLLGKYGVSADKAQAYANVVFGVNKDTYNQAIALATLSTSLDNTGKHVDGTKKKVGILKTELDKINGTYVVTVTDDGIKKVFNDLTSAVAYQEILRAGTQPTQSNMNKIKHQILDKNTFAAGGMVPGYSPNDRADNVPAMLTAKEWVQPVAAVKHYGPQFMKAVQTRQFPKGFAAGGGVNWPYPVKIPTDEINSRIAGLSNTTATGGVASGDLNVAAIAEATARAMGASDKELIALMEAGYVESGMRNLKRAVDHDSLGFLQQRPSQGWGTPAQITDVAHATRSFISRIKNVNHDLSPGGMAQAVQRSAIPDAYDKRYADAVAVLNAQAPYLTGAGGVPSGGATKASLVAFGRSLQARGYTVSENPAFGPVGKHTDGSKHYQGRAIDVNHGAGTSKQEQSYLAKIIPEAHRLGFHTIFMSDGHYNHAHIDFNKGGLVPARKYDTGGTLPPGYTMAYNGTGRNETIRTHTQEKSLSGPMRLDKRDIALLAAHIAQANNATVHMDGRKVAEITNTYTYLPAGV